MQTIIGAGGAIGVGLAESLTQYTKDIRLVSRNPKKVNETDTLFPADVTKRDDVFKAIEGSSICYVVVGFEYKIDVWRKNWPTLIKNVIDACEQYNCKLVFFDNVYAIGGDNVKHITEESPISPASKKGEVRAEVDRMILDAINKGRIEAIIARSPDFFGPVKATSITMNLIYDNLVKNKTAQWFSNAKVPHTTGYTPDLAKGTAILGNTPDAYNQIWNLPVDDQAPTGEEWVKLFAKHMGKPTKVMVAPKWLLHVLGVFIPIMKEMPEMSYQYDREYIFDSSKFKKRFNYTATTNEQAVIETLNALK
jgi:nucleoside-diphosphate-sugar epimerase